MSLVKQSLDDESTTEHLQRGWDEVYYGDEWPSEQECLDDEQRFNSSEPFRPFGEASDDD